MKGEDRFQDRQRIEAKDVEKYPPEQERSYGPAERMSRRVTPRPEDNKGAGRWLTDGTECRDEDIEG